MERIPDEIERHVDQYTFWESCGNGHFININTDETREFADEQTGYRVLYDESINS